MTIEETLNSAGAIFVRNWRRNFITWAQERALLAGGRSNVHAVLVNFIFPLHRRRPLDRGSDRDRPRSSRLPGAQVGLDT